MLTKILAFFRRTKPVPPPLLPIIVREDRDTLKPGAVVTHNGHTYRVTRLLMVSRLGAFYEAKVK